MSKPLIAKIHIAKKQLGLDDDTYRQALATATSGKTSCANMNENELQAVLDAFKSKGFNKGVGVDAVKWLNAYLASKVLEMLKQWHKRELLKWLVANGHERTNDIPVYKLTYEGLVWLFENVNNEARAK